MTYTFSPVSYAGGKSQLVPFMSHVISQYKSNPLIPYVFIEGFAGGAGLSMALLLNDVVSDVVLNDKDVSVFSFWYALKYEGKRFIDWVKTVPVDKDTRLHYKAIFRTKYTQLTDKQTQGEYELEDELYDFDLACAFFYLNRVNFSGIIATGGARGGGKSNAIGCRFNKPKLIKKMKAIIARRDSIHLYCQDITDFLGLTVPVYTRLFNSQAFLFLDPPYYVKGKDLYTSYFDDDMHVRLRDSLIEFENEIQSNKDTTNGSVIPWCMTYDIHSSLLTWYSDENIFTPYVYDLLYQIRSVSRKNELMIIPQRISSDTVITIWNKDSRGYSIMPKLELYTPEDTHYDNKNSGNNNSLDE